MISDLSPFSSADVVILDLDYDIYTADVIFRVAYDFTDRCFVFLSRPTDAVIRVALAPKVPEAPLGDVAGAFANALIDERVRQRVERETRPIRELLVAQAFSEADLLDRRNTEADDRDDPRGIARWQ